jgi:glycosyltransferase involved in cell wall biosynthesis
VFVQDLLDGLARRSDVEVVAFATSWRGRARLAGVVPPGVRTATRPLPAALAHAAWRRGDLPPVEWWTGRLDVVHGPNYVVPPARRAARVVSVHDLTVLDRPELCTEAARAHPPLVRRAVAGGAWVHVDATVVGRQVVAALGATPERVVRVPLAPSPLPPADPGRGRALAGADRFVLALGTLEPRKGLPGLVRAFDEVAGRPGLGDVALVLAGPPGWGVDELDRAVTSARHRDRIHRLGWVDGEGRSALLRAAEVLAFPSLDEGFGLPPLEAMSVGTPVVASRAGALPETLGDGAVLVATGDDAGLTEALARVLADPEHRRALVARGHDRVAGYSWERTVEGLVALYRRAVAGHR